MIRIRTLLCAASAACGLALGFNVSAQVTVTLPVTLPACTSKTYVLSGGTLTCTTGGGSGGTTPSCTLLGSTSSTVGTPIINPVSTGGGGGKRIPATCPDGTTTTSATLNSFTTGQGVTIDPFQNKQTAIWQINVPAMPANSKMVFPYAGNGGSINTSRVVYLSNTDPCDTSKLVGWTQSGAINATVNDGQSGITGSFAGAVAHMKTGDTWYIIIKNQTWRSGLPPYPDSCHGSDCPVLVSATPAI